MPLQLQTTKDNSHTLYLPELDETYHSRNGAIEEALYVYIDKGLNNWLSCNKESLNTNQNIQLLEVGFGTGLNAWLTALNPNLSQLKLHYHTIEPFPIPSSFIQELNYPSHFPNEQNIFYALHEAQWNREKLIKENFHLFKWQILLKDFRPTQLFDIIYFDAFAPDKQPELWTEEQFNNMAQWMNPNGCMVTYSAKGEVRRIWERCGLKVERLAGPPFKRHMLRGIKQG